MSGDLEYTEADNYGLQQLAFAVKWFDYHLKDGPAVENIGTFAAYCVRENRWRFWRTDFAPTSAKVMYLHPDTMLEVPCEYESSQGIVSDPENPTQSLRSGIYDGSGLCPEANQRVNTISFVSEPFVKNTEICGEIVAELYVSSPAPATAVAVAAIEVFEDGRSFDICENILDIRYKDGKFVKYNRNQITKICIKMPPVSWSIRKGSKLRIDISGSSYPAFHIHPNTDEVWGSSEKGDVVEDTIYVGGETSSRIILPVFEEQV